MIHMNIKMNGCRVLILGQIVKFKNKESSKGPQASEVIPDVQSKKGRILKTQALDLSNSIHPIYRPAILHTLGW